MLSPGEKVLLDTPKLDGSLVHSDILFCFESPTGWVRGTVSKDVRRQKNQYNFCPLWDDGEVQNLFLRPAKYTAEGHEPASWFVILPVKE